MSAKKVYKTHKSRKFDGYSLKTERKNRQIKHYVNKLFSMTANQNSRVLTLDAGSGNTSRHMHEKGVCAKNIIVPNPNVGDCESLESLGLSTPHNCKLSEYLNRLEQSDSNSVSHAWFDYCANWKNERNDEIKNDIKTFFKKQILTSGGEFSITFGLRYLRINTKQRKLKDYAKVSNNFITNIAKKYGYELDQTNQIFYTTCKKQKIKKITDHPNSSSMCFQMYKCKKN